MIDYPAALAVLKVVQTGSFEQAAKELNVTASAISQRVKIIEERLGVALIARGNPCVATEKGQWLCQHMEQIGMLENELIKHLPNLVETDIHSVQKVTVNIATNADSLGTWLLKALAPFIDKSGYLINLTLDDEGHTTDWLQQGKVLAAVTSSAKPVKGCKVLYLGALRYHATASPEFARKYFANGLADGIAHAPAITFNHKDKLQQEWTTKTLGSKAAFHTHYIPTTQGFIDACLAGIGWGMNPIHIVDKYLTNGKLVDLSPNSSLDVPLYWQVNHLAAKQLNDLTQHIINAARLHLIQ